MPTGVYKRTPETLRNISMAAKKVWKNASAARRKANAEQARVSMLKRHNAPGGKEKFSNDRKAWWKKHPEQRIIKAKMFSIISKDLWENNAKFRRDRLAFARNQKNRLENDPVLRKQVSKVQSKALKKYFQKEGAKEKQSLAIKKAWTKPECVENMLPAIMGNLKHITRVSKPQKTLFRRLCRAGVSGLKLEYRVGRKFVDIAHILTKTAIESDGAHWHESRSDKKRDRFLQKRGWEVIHITLNNRNAARKYDISSLVLRLQEEEL